MASISDIAEVRLNVDEATEDNWSDVVLGEYVDALGVAGATAKVWNQKAAKYATLVDTTEAGASHAFSDLHKNALAMAKAWQARVDVVVTAETGRPKIKKIVRL